MQCAFVRYEIKIKYFTDETYAGPWLRGLVAGLLLQKPALYFRFHPEPFHVKFVLDKIIFG